MSNEWTPAVKMSLRALSLVLPGKIKQNKAKQIFGLVDDIEYASGGMKVTATGIAPLRLLVSPSP